jgi:serine/threonine-protein kinase
MSERSVLLKYHPDATTRTARTAVSRRRSAGEFFGAGDTLASPETGLRYQIERLLGQGGFGQVYLAERLGRSTTVPETVCVKVSTHIDGWLREGYFGRILEGHPRAIQLFDIFPCLPRSGDADARVLYCLVLEFAPHGDLAAFLRRSPQGWSETAARREIAGILQVLGKLHRGQTLHRDLTPLNVFVCEGRRLKLGDFGIAEQQSNQRGVTARTLNAMTAPSDILARAVPKWQARDDVYQVGQLLGMLVKGDASARVTTRDIRSLTCSDQLKEIVYRCLGERRKRYESADEMIHALLNPPPSLHPGVLRTLKGVHLAFTGILSKTRRDAIKAAKRAGAIVHGMPSARTTVVVRGRPNPLQAAGRDGGLKLMEIKRLRGKGHKITLLSDRQFWKLVSRS